MDLLFFSSWFSNTHEKGTIEIMGEFGEEIQITMICALYQKCEDAKLLGSEYLKQELCER